MQIKLNCVLRFVCILLWWRRTAYYGENNSNCQLFSLILAYTRPKFAIVTLIPKLFPSKWMVGHLLGFLFFFSGAYMVMSLFRPVQKLKVTQRTIFSHSVIVFNQIPNTGKRPVIRWISNWDHYILISNKYRI